MTPRAILFSAISAGLIGPGSVGAQETASGPAAPTTARGNFWGLSFRLDETWDSNVRFDLAPGAADGLVHRGSLGLSYERRRPRGSISLSARGSRGLYSVEGMDQTTYGGGLGLTQGLSRRASLAVSASADSSYAYDNPTLVAEGLVLPRVPTRSYAAAGSLSFNPWSRLSAVGQARYERMSFDASQSQLLGGSTTTASAFLTPRLNGRDAVALGYELRNSNLRGQDVANHSATVGWTRTVAGRLTATLTGGATRFRLLADSDARWTVRAAAGLGVTRRRTTVGAQYDRSVDQAYGFGRNRISNVLSAQWSQALQRRLQLSASVSRAWSADPADPSFRIRTAVATTQIVQRLGRSTDVVASYGFRKLQIASADASRGHFVAVSVGYSREWRR